MAYQKQVWREYDDTKTELQNALNGALATPERLNHIENGIANSADKAEVTAQLQQTNSIKADKLEVYDLIGNVADGTPLFASNVAEMTDVTRLYVNGEDGFIYNHNGSIWVSTGKMYQAVSLGDNSVDYKKTNFLTPAKNLINPDELVKGVRLLPTGGTDSRADYSTSPYLELDLSETHITQSMKLILNFYSGMDASSFIETHGNLADFTNPRTIEIPTGAKYFRTATATDSYIPTYQVEYGTEFTGYEPFSLSIEKLKIRDGSVQEQMLDEKLRGRIFREIKYAFNDAYNAWINGDKFPIAFYSDSTTDGVGTTGWVGNTVGSNSTNTNAYPKLVENKLREMTGNSILRIYNAGYSGKTAKWGAENFDAVFKGTSDFTDVRLVGIGFGINDRVIYQTEKEYRDGFKADIIALINKCYENNIQPFLLTTQAVLSPGVRTTDAGTYPLRDAQRITTIANEVKKELAKQYNLDLIDVNKFTERFLKYSQVPTGTIISDRLHFGDAGHEYESGLIFAHIVPYTNFVSCRTRIDYSSQRLFKGVPEEWVANPSSFTGDFKTFVNTDLKGNTADTLIMSVYVFIDNNKQMTLKAYKNDISTMTYVKVNGISTPLDALEKTIGDLDLGLHHIEVWTGEHAKADFKGFIIE